ncbi:uncharacterized protein LOC124328563 isoform X2 [Daphnia pulicaria]|uniref:uncharacterized protein LOC124328563 isoform X2 n=2 Tax=Daphnia pulicaria TaxID=35523 RepID=UPI001EEC4150|nr:uncharacterized protein LOC124328563 isoform X2 [Daphnia pulicaria]
MSVLLFSCLFVSFLSICLGEGPAGFTPYLPPLNHGTSFARLNSLLRFFSRMEPLESAGSYHPYNPYNQYNPYNPYIHGHPQRGWPYYSSPMMPDYMDYHPPAYPAVDDMFYPNYPPLFDHRYAGYQQEGPSEFGEMFGSDDAFLGTLITDYLLATLSQPAIHQKPKQFPPVIPKPSSGSFGTKGNRVPKPVSFDLAGKDVQPATSVKTLVGSEASAAVSDADPVVPPKSLVASTTAHP